MKAIETTAVIEADGTLVGHVPVGTTQGRHRILVLVDEPAASGDLDEATMRRHLAKVMATFDQDLRDLAE